MKCYKCKHTLSGVGVIIAKRKDGKGLKRKICRPCWEDGWLDCERTWMEIDRVWAVTFDCIA